MNRANVGGRFYSRLDMGHFAGFRTFSIQPANGIVLLLRRRQRLQVNGTATRVTRYLPWAINLARFVDGRPCAAVIGSTQNT